MTIIFSCLFINTLAKMQAVSESDPLNSDFACAAYWLYTRSL